MKTQAVLEHARIERERRAGLLERGAVTRSEFDGADREYNVARLCVGQRAWLTAPAYGDRKFTGHVLQIGQTLGRKNVRTDEPTERAGTKILETLIELDPGQNLPIGLRVDAFLDATR
jgi:multidrug resistance efflux pump